MHTNTCTLGSHLQQWVVEIVLNSNPTSTNTFRPICLLFNGYILHITRYLKSKRTDFRKQDDDITSCGTKVALLAPVCASHASTYIQVIALHYPLIKTNKQTIRLKNRNKAEKLSKILWIPGNYHLSALTRTRLMHTFNTSVSFLSGSNINTHFKLQLLHAFHFCCGRGAGPRLSVVV